MFFNVLLDVLCNIKITALRQCEVVCLVWRHKSNFLDLTCFTPAENVFPFVFFVINLFKNHPFSEN